MKYHNRMVCRAVGAWSIRTVNWAGWVEGWHKWQLCWFSGNAHGITRPTAWSMSCGAEVRGCSWSQRSSPGPILGPPKNKIIEIMTKFKHYDWQEVMWSQPRWKTFSWRCAKHTKTLFWFYYLVLSADLLEKIYWRAGAGGWYHGRMVWGLNKYLTWRFWW